MRSGRASVIAAVTIGMAACSGPSGTGLTEGQTSYLTTSGTIDSRLTGDREQTLTLGRTICAELAASKPDSVIIADAQRFTQGEGVISKDQAAKLVAAARKGLCA